MSDGASAGRDGGTAFLVGQMLLCSLLWAPAFLLMKRIGADLSPLSVTALRDTMGGGLLAIWFLSRGQRVLPKGREWHDWAVLGTLQVIVPNTLTVYALAQITTSLAALIQTATPLIVACLAPLLFASEAMSRRRMLGLALGLAGVLALIGPAMFSTAASSTAGILAMAFVPVSYALGNLYVRAIPKAEPARLAYGQLAFSALPALLLTWATQGGSAFAPVPGHMLELIALALFATALPLVLFMRILREAGPTLGTMVGYLIPLWVILLGTLLLDERLEAREIVGGLTLLAGLLLASMTRRPA